MTLDCPFCGTATPAGVAECAGCRAKLLKKCTYCAEEIAIMARKCRYCRSDLVENLEPQELMPAMSKGGTLTPRRPIVFDLLFVGGAIALSGLVTIVVLVVSEGHLGVTCGLGGLVLVGLMAIIAAPLTYRLGTDLNSHAGRAVVRPELDTILTLVTGGLWGIVVALAYPNRFNEIERREGVPSSDILALSVMLACVGLAPIGQILLQDAMNRHGDLHLPGHAA